MLTYTGAKTIYQSLTNNNETANGTFFDTMYGESIRTVASIRSGRWKWLETVETVETISGRQYYGVPNKIRKVVDVYIQIQGENGVIWMPIQICDPTMWKRVLSAKLGNGDIPRFCYIQNDTIYFSPIPQTDGNRIRLRGRLNLIDLNIADYTTGTIVSVPYTTTLTGAVADGDTSATLSGAWALSTGTYSMEFSSGEARQVALTNGATTVTWTNALTEAGTTAITVSTSTGGSIVTGSGTTWTTGMIGRYIKITNTTAANGGDGFWYKIAGRESNTVITLEREYQGDAISAGSATYTIGQASPIPEAYDMIPIYRCLALYWDQKGDANRANSYWRQYDGGVEKGLSPVYGGFVSQLMEESGATFEGAYASPIDVYGRLNPNDPEPDIAASSFI